EQNDPENEELRYRINAFDWEEEFAKIMGNGGFDVVIGNPPYLYSAGQNYPDYFNKNYQLKQYQTDFYVYFIERALSLSHKEGKLSFIVPDSWLNSQHFSKVRNHLLTKHKLDKILIFDYLVFKGVTLENSIFILSIAANSSQFPIDCLLKSKKFMTLNTINPKNAVALGLINPRMSRNLERVLGKIEQGSIFLEDKVKINRGIHAYRTDGYGKSKFGAGYQIRRDKDEESYHADMPLDDTYLLEIKGKHLDRYTFKNGGKYLSYGNWLAEARTPEFFFQPKITLRKILSVKLHGTFFEKAVALDQSLYIMISKNNDTEELKHILGLLLSKIGAWYLKHKYAIYDQLYPWYTKKQLSVFPIKEKSELMLNLVNQMLILHQQLNDATSNHKKETIQRQINRTDKKIDNLVYELYDLTPNEIAIVEEAC
ncbi:MAG: restriction endonuclease subunit M, partial [Gammaproteobacteria bacterium]